MKKKIKFIIGGIIGISISGFLITILIPITLVMAVFPSHFLGNFNSNNYQKAWLEILVESNAITRVDVSILQAIDEVFREYESNFELKEESQTENENNQDVGYVYEGNDPYHIEQNIKSRLMNYIDIYYPHYHSNNEAILLLKPIEEIEVFINSEIEKVLMKTTTTEEEIRELIGSRLWSNYNMGQYKLLQFTSPVVDNYFISARYAFYDYQINANNNNETFDFHRGIDLAIPTNTEVLSVANGVVVDVVNSCSGINLWGSDGSTNSACYPSGNYIKIRHDMINEFTEPPENTEEIEEEQQEILTLFSYYAHLENVIVSVGDEVEQGDLIGLSGNTGNSSGSHLHFEILEGSITKNPELFIKFNSSEYDGLFNLFPFEVEEDTQEIMIARVFLREIDKKINEGLAFVNAVIGKFV